MAHTPMSLVVTLARNFTPQELCREVEGLDPVEAGRYLDALALHAKRSSWGDLIEQSINGWKGAGDGAPERAERGDP